VRPTNFAKPQTYIDDFNMGSERVELFAPIIRIAEVVGGKVVFKEKLLTFYYVFVKGTLKDVKELCAIQGNGFSFMLDRGSEKHYGIISEEAMKSFKLIARLYSNTIPFYDIENIELEDGDLVEVVDGDYAGLTGTFMPKSRSNKGNLVIAATAASGAVVWDIDAKYVRILKFARNTHRQYDLLDSFIPKLFPILRKFHAGDKLTEKDKSLLSVFNQRMGAVSLDNNHKLEAKLLATLMCVQYILGDMHGYDESARRFGKCKNAITNIWTQALTSLLLFVVKNDIACLADNYKNIESTSEKLTESHKQLVSEYKHYLAICD